MHSASLADRKRESMTDLSCTADLDGARGHYVTAPTAAPRRGTAASAHRANGRSGPEAPVAGLRDERQLQAAGGEASRPQTALSSARRSMSASSTLPSSRQRPIQRLNDESVFNRLSAICRRVRPFVGARRTASRRSSGVTCRPRDVKPCLLDQLSLSTLLGQVQGVSFPH